MRKTIKLKNCWDEIKKVCIDLDKTSLIIIYELSGDHILSAFDLNGYEYKHVDSDTHMRCEDCWGGFDVIYLKGIINKIDEYNKTGLD